MPFWGDERDPCIKSNERILSDQWIRGKARIGERVRHLKDRALQNSMGTEGHVPRRFVRRHSNLRLEPLSMGVDQTH